MEPLEDHLTKPLEELQIEFLEELLEKLLKKSI